MLILNRAIEPQTVYTELGRANFANAVPLDRLQLISRRHFASTRSDERYYIEDVGSTNGTTVNGRAIQGMGKVALTERDRIDIPNAVRMMYVKTMAEEQ